MTLGLVGMKVWGSFERRVPSKAAMDPQFSAIMARRKRASEAKMASEAGAAPASDEAEAPEYRASPASQVGPDDELSLKLEKMQQRIAAGGTASHGQKPDSVGAAPASEEAGARENRPRPASQDDPGAELRLEFEKRQQSKARAAAEGTSAGEEPGPAAAGASKSPAPVPHEAGARARQVSGIGASTGASTGAKAPKEIVRKHKGGIGDLAGAVAAKAATKRGGSDAATPPAGGGLDLCNLDGFGRHPPAVEADSAEESLEASNFAAPPRAVAGDGEEEPPTLPVGPNYRF